MRLRPWLVLLPLIAACAQVRNIEGGEKDEVAPQLERADPPPLTTNFSASSPTRQMLAGLSDWPRV